MTTEQLNEMMEQGNLGYARGIRHPLDSAWDVVLWSATFRPSTGIIEKVTAGINGLGENRIKMVCHSTKLTKVNKISTIILVCSGNIWYTNSKLGLGTHGMKRGTHLVVISPAQTAPKILKGRQYSRKFLAYRAKSARSLRTPI